MQIHVVQKGENLWQISERYGVSINRIIAVNGLEDPNHLVIGLALLIPEPYPEYVVQSGDSLGTIAGRYGISVEALAQANSISDVGQLRPGQVLVIPVLRHTVRPGETLWAIAHHYGVSMQAISQANGITNANLISSGQILKIPEKQKMTIDVNAYTNVFGETAARQVREDGEHLTYVCPFGYRMKDDGTLEPADDQALIAAAYDKRVVPVMSITNFSATETGSKLAHTILSSTELQNKLLTNIITIMETKGYRGLNVDFENVYPSDRESYNQFLRLAVLRLHEKGFFVSTALAPKTSSEQKGLLYEAHDYAAHGEIVDFVVLMTYEWGYRFGPPQAISPINEIRRVLDYAVTVIPRKKIFMGFQLYARDWLLPHVKGQQAETFSMQEAVRRAIKHGAEIKYDQVSQTPYYRYADDKQRTHEVWFEDARSTQAKFNLVTSYNLRGVSYWVLGYPFPQNWPLLEDNFHVRKLL
ncbi:LysM peptidoglycan-binding domain-containing protein [Paenibacillus planticolens]|uniref:LysM peptidoglycan-binding domain-containing protein n=1 Tax=Paenibacillus planticolens TaxID=2654976 RepID=A0ABX1ZFF6_9BACL|nr:LysM peptidoglycan-binding domain-containing protein [Paenibacillus planticolens]NOU98828.1 LysM peptidoglycan-binding domain-containing protein [Paenibacillus planticolens]